MFSAHGRLNNEYSGRISNDFKYFIDNIQYA